jgi:hypothetical protein
MIHLGQFDRDRLVEVLRVFPPVVKSRKATALGKDQPISSDRVHELLLARYDGITHLDEIDDRMFHSARDSYKTNHPNFLLRTYEGISSETYHRIAEESLNKACVDFATALGRMRSQAMTSKASQDSDTTNVPPDLRSQDLAKGGRREKRREGKPRRG